MEALEVSCLCLVAQTVKTLESASGGFKVCFLNSSSCISVWVPPSLNYWNLLNPIWTTSSCLSCWLRQRLGRSRGGRRRICQACQGQMKSELYKWNPSRKYLKRKVDLTGKHSFLRRFHFREKPSSMMEEDFNCSSRNVLGSSLPSAGTPGLTSPPYVATPFDHDYAKRKTLRRQQWQQQRHEEQQADGTVPVLDTVSGVGLFAFFCTGTGSPPGVCSER